MPAAQPVVRTAVPADAEPVAAIFAHYVTTSVATFEEVAPTAAAWRQRFDDLAARNLPFLVAEAEPGGSVCGFAYASLWRPKPGYRHTVEDTVYLSPGHTGRGIGSALLGTLLAGCADAGARQVIAVIADTGSDASAALHRRFGFIAGGPPVRRRPQARPLDRHLADAKRPGTRPLSTAFSAGDRTGERAWAS